jgi:hypothetical protein
LKFNASKCKKKLYFVFVKMSLEREWIKGGALRQKANRGGRKNAIEMRQATKNSVKGQPLTDNHDWRNAREPKLVAKILTKSQSVMCFGLMS